MIIEVSGDLELALREQAQEKGVSTERFARGVLERALKPGMQPEESGPTFETGRGMLAKYGPAPSAEEIDANREDMFRGFGEEPQ